MPLSLLCVNDIILSINVEGAKESEGIVQYHSSKLNC